MLYDDRQPIYMQIMDDLKKQIISGKLRPGDRLLPVRDMAMDFKVNPNTIQRSYQELEREGVIMTQRGIGSFVIEDGDKIQELKASLAVNIVNGFLKQMKDLGFDNLAILNLIKEQGEVIHG